MLTPYIPPEPTDESFIKAAKEGRVEILEWLLSNYPDYVICSGLLEAVLKKGDYELFKHLIEIRDPGHDINECLYYACHSNSLEMVKEFVDERGAKVYESDDEKEDVTYLEGYEKDEEDGPKRPIMAAVQNSRKEIAIYLLEKNAFVPLDIFYPVISTANEEMLQVLLQHAFIVPLIFYYCYWRLIIINFRR